MPRRVHHVHLRLVSVLCVRVCCVCVCLCVRACCVCVVSCVLRARVCWAGMRACVCVCALSNSSATLSALGFFRSSSVSLSCLELRLRP
jgi:hypothetical protein